MGRRIRTIKPEWLDDEKLCLCTPHARLLSVALLLLADDYGHGRGYHTWIASQVFPMHNPEESLRLTEEGMSELISIGFVRMYEVRDQSYFEIVNWSKHQRIDKPSKPQVPGPCDGHTTTDTPPALYFIRSRTTGLIMIGAAYDPIKKLSTLAQTHKTALDLLAVRQISKDKEPTKFATPSRESSESLARPRGGLADITWDPREGLAGVSRHIRELFLAHHVHAEWFRASPEVLEIAHLDLANPIASVGVSSENPDGAVRSELLNDAGLASVSREAPESLAGPSRKSRKILAPDRDREGSFKRPGGLTRKTSTHIETRNVTGDFPPDQNFKNFDEDCPTKATSQTQSAFSDRAEPESNSQVNKHKIRASDYKTLGWELYHALRSQRYGNSYTPEPGDDRAMAKILGRMRVDLHAAIETGKLESTDVESGARIWLTYFWSSYFQNQGTKGVLKKRGHPVKLAEKEINGLATPPEFR